jgi:hypothetical protein
MRDANRNQKGKSRKGKIYRTSAAPKITMKAANMEPLAIPKDAGAAPPAGGASAAPAVGEEVPEPPVVVDDPAGLLVGPFVKLALGPTALFDNKLVEPLMVAALLSMLATAPVVELAAEDLTALLDMAEGFCGNVTWIRISSHWAPIHSSYRL